MAEGTEIAESTSEETQVATAPVSIVGEDGKFAENWKETLPEDIRGEVCLGTVNDIPSMAKQFVHAQRMIGKDKIALPKEDSPDAVWDAFYTATGRPTTPADYNLKAPKDFPEELFSTEMAGKAQDLFHKIGLNQKQADALLAFNTDAALVAMQNEQNADELSMKELTDGLYAEWGNAFEQKKHFGNMAVTEAVLGDEEFQKRLMAKYGNDPDLIRAFANLGAKFAEHGAPTVPQIPTPTDYDQQIQEIMNTPEYRGGGEIPQAVHDAAVAKVNRLLQQKSETIKPTG